MRFYLRLWTSFASLLALSGLLAACSRPVSEPAPGNSDRTPPAQGRPAPGATSQSDHSVAAPTLVPGSESSPTTGAVPDTILQAIIADLAARLGSDPGAFEVIKAESVVWGDGSLGCPEPGMMYTEALVNGYWVVIKADGQAYDYRASQKGYFRLCEGKGSGPVVGPGGEPVFSPDR
jgi:hypothetical protein